MRSALFCLLSIFFFVVCNELTSTNPQPPLTPCTPLDDPEASHLIQVVYPSEGDTLKIGQTINIKFKFEKAGGTTVVVKDVMATILLNSGKIKKGIFEKSQETPTTGSITCVEIPWTIGSEYNLVDYSDTNKVMLKVWQYGSESQYYHTTKSFYIVK